MCKTRSKKVGTVFVFHLASFKFLLHTIFIIILSNGVPHTLDQSFTPRKTLAQPVCRGSQYLLCHACLYLPTVASVVELGVNYLTVQLPFLPVYLMAGMSNIPWCRINFSHSLHVSIAIAILLRASSSYYAFKHCLYSNSWRHPGDLISVGLCVIQHDLCRCVCDHQLW